MQSASAPNPAHRGHLAQSWNTSSHMYPNSTAHQRNPANPRSTYDTAGSGGDDQYSGYQQGTGFGNVGVGGYNYSSNMSSLYNTTSPSLPSARRTSNPKASSPIAPSTSAANTSPSAYYPRQPASGADVTQSPYQSSTAPPNLLSHHGQSQPYGYYPYYDQQAHHASGGSSQWQHQYGNPSSFTQQGVQGRQTSSSSIPAVASVSSNEQSRTSGNSFDYSSTTGQSGYQNWDSSRGAPGHQWQQTAQQQGQQGQQQQGQQTQNQQRSASGSSGQAQSVMSPWQGYGSGHHPFPPQQVAQMGGQLPPNQYGNWNQWGGNQQYYQQQQQQQQQQQATQQQQPQVQQQQQPASSAQAAPAAATTPVTATPTAAAPAATTAPAPAATGKKSKTSKKEAAAAAAAAAAQAAEPAPAPAKEPKSKKRASEKEPKEDTKAEEKKAKKSKKEEKPPPKQPLKSQLKMPRQAPSAWQLFFTDELNKAKAAAAADAGSSPGGTPIHPKLNVAQIAKDAGVAYAKLGPERKAYYARKVEEGKAQYLKERAAWEATLTPEDIKNENAFRALQRKEGKSRKGNLKDPNAPKKPLSAYFLFLKGIRENDDLRNQVWGDESETTRQSVLAAEKWRGLSDDEKRPYLQQAEKDKQEYESLRKIYEDDAAARARGEAANDRPTFPEIQSAVIVPPKSLLEGKKGDRKHKNDKGKAAFSPDGQPGFETGLEMDSFHGFEDMDLAGLEGMTGHGASA